MMGKFFWGAVLVLAVAASGFSFGKSHVQSKWDKDTASRVEAMSKLRLEYTELEGKHAIEVKNLNDDLAKAQAEHEASLAGFRNDYDGRLLLATNRADVYKRQAQGSSVEQQRLASHAAELDRSLEEGRYLVRQLRETIGQRDAAIQALSRQIIADRKLYTDSE